ncbi:hypothetical protein ACQEVZ_38640 [Dactylosporangium sp. CA-152071]|uniref:hypothetical protein n=1 Tax=Dactylosporangium sp. CA-152071 TaxID=3239933 RepID=UPI003D918D54
MKARQVVLLAVAGVLVLCGVGVLIAVLTMSGDDKPTAAASDAAVTPYTATAVKQGADLVAPGVTVDGARAAISDWLAKNAGDSKHLVVTVVRAAADKTYVCRAEYVADEQTAAVRTGGRVKGPYPATVVNCPDPKGA